MNSMRIKREYIFPIIALMIYSIAIFLQKVDIDIDISITNRMAIVGCIIGICGDLYSEKINSKYIVKAAAVIGLLLLASAPSGTRGIVYLLLIIWSVREVDLYYLIRFEMFLMVIAVIIVLTLVGIGAIPDTIYMQNIHVRPRHSLGFISWTILPFIYISILLCRFVISHKRVKLIEVSIYNGIALLIWYYTDLKSVVYYVFAICAVYWLMPFFKVKKWERLYIFISIPWLLPIVSLTVAYMYEKQSQIFTKIDQLLTYRVSLTNRALHLYSFDLLSNPNAVFSNETEYLVVDNSYISVLISYGLIALIILLLMYASAIYYAIRNQDLKLLVAIITLLFIFLLWDRMIVLIDSVSILGSICLFNDSIGKHKLENESGGLK